MNDSTYIAYVLDQIGVVDGVSIKKMFGGLGVFVYDAMFGLVIDNQLYLKVNTKTVPMFEKCDSYPFSYIRKDKKVLLPYWLVPEEVLEDRGAFHELVDAAIEVVLGI